MPAVGAGVSLGSKYSGLRPVIGDTRYNFDYVRHHSAVSVPGYTESAPNG